MTKFRKKPVVIEAIQFNGQNSIDVHRFMNYGDCSCPNDAILIKTLEGEMRADIDDWIIRGVKGELYPCKPDIFEATYDRI